MKRNNKAINNKLCDINSNKGLGIE